MYPRVLDGDEVTESLNYSLRTSSYNLGETRLGQGLSAGSLHVLPVSAWVSSALQKFRLICYSKLSASVRECEWLFFLICQPCDEQMTYPGCTPPLAPMSAGISSSPPDPEKDKRLQTRDGGMDDISGLQTRLTGRLTETVTVII